MVRIEDAVFKLTAAVERLEQIARERPDGLSPSSEELSALRSECEALRLTGTQASGRIDAAIGRLRTILDN